MVSFLFGILSLGGVICFYFPDYLTTPEFRSLYPIPLLRSLIWLLLLLSLIFGFVDLLRKKHLRWNLLGLVLSIVSLLLGGGGVPLPTTLHQTTSFSLDWFLLDILLLGLIFIPLERLFPLKKDQKLWRIDIRKDLFYFFVNHVLFQMILAVTTLPANWFKTFFGLQEKLHLPIPGVLQLPLIILTMDFFQYWIHRAFHRVPWLWRFHSVHHSIEKMDWIAGSRLHLVDILVTRALLFLPLTILGFDPMALQIYLIFAAFQTVFIHANVSWRFDHLSNFLTTPLFHHWHHAIEEEAIDKNFAVHLPVLDRIFGTFYVPSGEWPSAYGLTKKGP